MSSTLTSEEAGEVLTAEVVKSDLPSLLSALPETGLDGEFTWPIPPFLLAQLYRASPEHGRAIHVKAEGSFGGGLIGDADRLGDLTERGASDLFTSLGLDLETFGNAFLQLIWASDGDRLLGLRRLPAITMSRYRGGFLQRVTLPNGRTKKITFSANEVIQLRDPCPMGRRYSLPSWIGGEGMLELALAATRYNASFFKNNAMPEYAITFKGKAPTKEQKEAIRAFFRNDFQGLENAHRTLLLTTSEDSEIEIERLTADIKDADFLKLLDAARDRIPTAHGTPPRILGIAAAGQLGGGGELSGQMFLFEKLSLAPKRRRMLEQIGPVLRAIGVTAGQDPDNLGDGEIAFRPLDLTPPKDDVENLPELVQAGILDPAFAATLLPYAQDAQGAGAGAEIERAAPKSQVEALAALLAKL